MVPSGTFTQQVGVAHTAKHRAHRKVRQIAEIHNT
jgi:hypothetical protein